MKTNTFLLLMILAVISCKKDPARDSIFDQKSENYIPPPPPAVGSFIIHWWSESMYNNNILDINEKAQIGFVFTNTGKGSLEEADVKIICSTLKIVDTYNHGLPQYHFTQIGPGKNSPGMECYIDLTSQPEPTEGMHTVWLEVTDKNNTVIKTSLNIEYRRQNVKIQVFANNIYEDFKDGILSRGEHFLVQPSIINRGTVTSKYIQLVDVSLVQGATYASKVTKLVPKNYGIAAPNIEVKDIDNYCPIGITSLSTAPKGTQFEILFTYNEEGTNRKFYTTCFTPPLQ